MHPLETLTKEKEYGAADTHIHSSVGDGMASVSDILDFVAQRGDLNVIAITDHDDISGSYQARELAAKRDYTFEIAIGMEVTTLEGHLLALFIEHTVPSHQPLEATISAVHAQGGLCIMPHPMNWLTDSIGRHALNRIASSGEADIYFDGMETVNATIVGNVFNRRAKHLNHKHNLAETGGSDAHFLTAVGSGLTLFPGRTAQELKTSILERTSQAQNGSRVSYSDIGLSQILRQQRKSGAFFVRGMFKNIARAVR